MKTRVVNIRDNEPYSVYIGRAVPRRGLKKSPYANPFKIDKDRTREEVIEEYREWFLAQPELVEKARKEHENKHKDKPYKIPFPEGLKPPFRRLKK